MLILSLLIAASATCGFATGSALVAILASAGCIDRPADRVIISTWLGLLVLANAYFAAALFSPLRPAVVIAVTVALLVAALLSQRNRAWIRGVAGTFPAGPLIGVTALMLGIAAYCSQVIVWYDTRLYHMQVIKWLSEYGLVSGLGLIHARFGYPSSWFGLAASVNQGLLQGRVGSFTGGLCLLLLVIHFLVALERVLTGRGRPHDLFIVLASFLALIIIMVYGMPNSPAPDLPVIILVIETAWSILVISEFEQNASPAHDSALNARLIPLLLAAGAVSIKLSALPLLAVAGGYYLSKGRCKPGKLILAGITLIFFLAPLAAAGVITTGCAFFPSAAFCSDLPWSLGAGQARAEAELIRDWARWGGRPAPDGATAWNWIVPWFAEEKVCSLLLVLSALAALVMVIRHAGKRHVSGHVPVAALAILGIAFMLYAAPSWRFGLGYLVILPALAAAGQLPWPRLSSRRFRGISPSARWSWLGGVTALAIATHVYVVPRPTFRALEEVAHNPLIAGNDNPHFNLVLPPRLWRIQFAADKASGRKSAMIDAAPGIDRAEDFTYYHPGDPERSELCGDAPLPCALGKLYGLQLREPVQGIAGGFAKSSISESYGRELP